MAKCSLCNTAKGKRYCPALDRILCPRCCASKRLVEIDCPANCRYLEGAVYQTQREEDKRLNDLINSVPHGQFDDIFHRRHVPEIAYEIESFMGMLYINGEIKINDTICYEAYKAIFLIEFEHNEIDPATLSDVALLLHDLFQDNQTEWEKKIDLDLLGQIFLRMMRSIRSMSGGRMGDFGYLNYIKNNIIEFDPTLTTDEFIMEDRFGRKTRKKNPLYHLSSRGRSG